MKTSHFLIYTLLYVLLLAGCKSYQVDYRGPDEQKTYSLNKDKISNKEKAAWEKATDANSVNAYKKYIKDFPEGKYVAEAKNNIDRAYDRLDELYAISPVHTFDINLEALFSQPIYQGESIELIVYHKLSNEPLEGAQVQILTDCKGEQQNFTTDQTGSFVFLFKKGCCYTIDIDKFNFTGETRKICTADLKDDLLRFYLPELLKSSGSDDSYPVLNSDGKYYDSATGELFTGNFKGDKFINGKNVTDKKTASSEENLLWNAILNADDPEVAKIRIQAYLQKYPQGKYADDVTRMLESLDHTAGIEPGGGTDPGGEEITDKEETSPPSPSAVVTTDPPVATADTVVLTKMLTEDCAFNVKSKGLLAYNTLETTMKTDTSYTLEILINDLMNLEKIKTVVEKKTGEKLDTMQLVHEGTTTIGNNVVEMIRIGSWMRVTLSEPKNQDAFSISNVYENSEENRRGKNIDCDMNVKWKFLIAPKKGGDYKLLLNFYIKNNEGEPYKILLDEEKTISVSVKKPWYAQLWVQGIFAIGLLGLLLLFFLRKKKKQPDQIFGANLGIAGGLEKIAPRPTKPKSIFIAYAKEDEEWTKQIYNQMKVLHKGGYANIWYDQLMEAGAEYKAEIFKHLEESDIIMLNISSDFLACDFCDELLNKAMERHERGEGVMLIPIIVRPCLWATTPLAKMMVFPQNKKPLSDEEWKNSDNAIVNVMNEMEGKILN